MQSEQALVDQVYLSPSLAFFRITEISLAVYDFGIVREIEKLSVIYLHVSLDSSKLACRCWPTLTSFYVFPASSPASYFLFAIIYIFP